MSRYIDADILEELVEEEFDGIVVYDVPPDEAVADICDIIDSCPTVDVTPVVNAHWIHLGGGLAKCSNCKWIFKDVYDQDNEDTFCRKCGAKMDEEV